MIIYTGKREINQDLNIIHINLVLEDSKEIIKFKEKPDWPSRTHNDIINLSEIKTKKISWIEKIMEKTNVHLDTS